MKKQVPHPPNLGFRRLAVLYLGMFERTDFAFFVEKALCWELFL
ncbi:MAG TPA: hypothetical protein VHP14_18080 [Anaerolineales bacterium]|nr:hypothetical protein [Anaerolineales bacterium]